MPTTLPAPGEVSTEALAQAVGRLLPGARLLSAEPLGAERPGAVARKATGYGRPVKLQVELPGGERRALVFRTAAPDEFGHDRRSDRTAELQLSFDTFELVPDHVLPLDVGALTPGGLTSLRGAGEPYLITDFAEGRLYADDLRALARDDVAPLDLDRARALARWLARLHATRLEDPVAWRRAVRDLVGSGEGIFGLVDAYPPAVPGARPAALQALERQALDWRWRLRDRADRLRRIHGDFHPFNLLFDAGLGLTVLDASRGAAGDPADDVTALSVNYLFFALQAPGRWRRGFAPLWTAFWETYLSHAGEAVLEAAPPFLAWRALVLCCPRFYPDLPATTREALLAWAGRVAARDRFDPALAAELFP
ncbi:MAG: aminoglycoside phosphotransferase family protein [Anaeromyxobacter sp.]|nr:aminoglycoside phosphotransferase family protein [Anaeromyxobacter sp.]MBL0278193.1 aminoglycoside phosphotransferase family protein [Anaeromyxobacter sp.]